MTNDTATNASTYYPLMSYNATTGSLSTANTSSTKLYFNPSTGTLAATTFSGSGASLTGLTAGNLTGTITSSVLGNSNLYIGTTAVPLNASSGSITSLAVNISGSAGSVAAGSITGTTLASGVTASSLTSLGSLTGLTVAGQASATRGYREGVVAVGTVSSPTNLDMSLGNIFTVTLAASTTLTFTNVPSSGSGCYVTVVITQDGTGSRTPTFSPTPKWTDGVSPTYSGANKTDIISFLCVAGSFYGSLAMANM